MKLWSVSAQHLDLICLCVYLMAVWNRLRLMLNLLEKFKLFLKQIDKHQIKKSLNVVVYIFVENIRILSLLEMQYAYIFVKNLLPDFHR
ncbi:hypothetical protein BpHYR1_008303 [Brachionus plicatilis]|uniref:Uncharacterized protein n=1 Tax=Brachionus plicatilis TaxID=10195 RepID=A0A3M7RZ08_BRAPC|nr:hypothetical protein BpHYR1_008303 [Brachionus plicatilis]